MTGIIKERQYELDSLVAYIKARTDIYVKQQSALRSTDSDFQLRQTTQRYFEDAPYGNEGDKLYVKQIIRKMMTDENGGQVVEFPANYKVTEANIDKFIDWSDTSKLDAYVLFLAALYHKKETLGADALGALITENGWNELRELPEGEGVGFFVTEDDIREMWQRMGFHPVYQDKLNILVQLVYEENFGNSCIDEILYQNVGDICAGVSGIPTTINMNSTGSDTPAYDTCWVRYHGSMIHFMFLSFGSYERLKEIVKKSVGYKMRGQFSEKEGFKLGYGKDGSRRTAAIEPFGEYPALWVRKFTEQKSTNEDLYGGVQGAEIVAAVEKALVRGGATIPICGAQGSGKTTKLETIARYIQNFYGIRVLESEFEARLRWKYPLKNIYSMEANENTDVKPSDAYNFSLRSAGDIYIIGEARSDDMIINVTRTANRGGRSVLFTFHPKTADMTIPEIANAMIRLKMYSNLKDAISTALKTVHVCIFVTVDVETHKHFYGIYEFVPRPNVIPDTFAHALPENAQMEFMKTMHAYMQTMANADTYYETVPIVVYDQVEQRYIMKNTVSDAFYEELLEKTPRREEVLELMRVFRPDDFIRAKAREAEVELSPEYVAKLINEYGLERKFIWRKQ